MNFKKVFIRNFKNYKKQSLDLESNSFWILRGKNSSGKSTLACDALTYALFGKIKAMDDPQDTKISIDDIVKRGETKALVRIEFTNKQDNFVIERERIIKKTASRESISIKRNGKIIHQKDAPKTKGDQWIRNNLFTYKDFTNTTLIMQDEMTKALELRTGERKDYLERLFGIKDFQEMGVLSREKGKEITSELSVEDATISEKKKSLIDENDLEKTKLKLEKDSLKAENSTNKILTKKENTSNKLDKSRRILTEFANLKETIIQNEKRLISQEEALKKNQEELGALNTKIADKDEYQEKLTQIEIIEKQLKDLEATKDQLKSQNKLKDNLKRQMQKEEESIKSEISRRKMEKKESEKDIEDLKKDLLELQTLKSEKPILETELANGPNILEKLKSLIDAKEIVQSLKNEKDKKENERNIKLDGIEKEIQTKQKQVDLIDKYEADYENRERAKNDLKTYENQLSLLADKKNDIQEKIMNKNTTIQVKKNSLLSNQKNLQELEYEIENISIIHDQASCPTCKQHLTESHVKTIVSDLKSKYRLLQDEHDNAEKSVASVEKEVMEDQTIYDAKQKQYNETKETISKLRDASEGIQASKNKLDEVLAFQKEIKNIQESGGLDSLFSDLKIEISTLQEKISELKHDPVELERLQNLKNDLLTKKEKLRNINTRLPQLEKSKYKLNQVEITLQECTKAIKDQENRLSSKDYGKQEAIEIKELQNEINKLEIELDAEIIQKEKLISLNPEIVRSKLKEIKESTKLRDNLDGELKNQTRNFESLKNENQEIIKSLESTKFENINEKVKQQSDQLKEVDDQYVKSITDKEHANNLVKQHLELVEKQSKIRKEINEIEANFKDKSEDRDTYQHLEKIFNQIGGRILSRLRYQINVATIDILSLLGNSQLEGITLNDDFSLTIQTPQGEEKPSFFSGGQKVRIGFAFRLALSKVLAEFKGNELDTLIIDEGGFGALDDDGQEGVIDVFKSLQDRFERVLIISHIPKITNNLPGAQLQIVEGKIIDQVN